MRVSSLQADGFGRFGERLYFCGTQLLRPSKMRQCVLVWLASLFLLAGCRQGVGDSPGLVELDSLIAAAPDSAAARLAAWPADSLRTAADRAYHALLLTQARYKAYIPLDSGSPTRSSTWPWRTMPPAARATTTAASAHLSTRVVS